MAVLLALASDYRETLRSVVLSLNQPSELWPADESVRKNYIN